MSARIANFAKPGSLFKQYEIKLAFNHRGRVEDRAHLSCLRKLPCVVCGGEPCDAAHVRAPSAPHGKPATPTARKPDDRWAIPLCRACHRKQHTLPEIRFWWDAQISPVKLCIDLYRVTGDLEGMRKVIVEARR